MSLAFQSFWIISSAGLLAGFLMSGTPFSSAMRPPYDHSMVTMLLLLSSSGGWPAARAADSLARICGDPGIDCHSTSVLFCLPHSTKIAPTASSVTVFQLAENHTDILPGASVAWAAGAVVGAAA